MDVKIYKRGAEVCRFADLVQKQGDSERDMLGFLPRSVYTEAAVQGKLYVATVRVAGEEHYAGHLLYGGRFPHLRVFQMYTLPEFRGRHIGRQLTDMLASDAEANYYLTISARVAADLPANEFWERMGFRTIRTLDGGATTGRQINLRRRELNSPTLFSIPNLARVSALPKPASAEQPLFALDVNVFLDVVKDRPRAEYAKRLLTAAMSGLLRLSVAREFIEELARAAQGKGSDPVLQLAMTLPQFTSVPSAFMDNLKRDLAALIFPNRAGTGQLRLRDHSDLTHLATMIYHSASGFVTSDESILSKRGELQNRYLIEVLGPAELAELYLPSQWAATHLSAESSDGSLIKIAEMDEARRPEVESFLKSCSMGAEQVARAILPGQSACPRHRVVVLVASEVIGFASWDAGHGAKPSIEAWVGVDPANLIGELACDVLLEAIFRSASRTRPASVVIDGAYMTRGALEYARNRGFRPAPTKDRHGLLQKYCIGKIITPACWAQVRAQLFNLFSFKIPPAPPAYSGRESCITVERAADSADATLSLREFELQYGPVILMIPGRPVVVVPIQRSYADKLLCTADQHSLFPLPEASVIGEKLYLSNPRTLSALVPGAVLLFYESMGTDNGRGAIVAAAQVTRTAIKEVTDIDARTSRRGVLNSEEVNSLSSGAKIGLTFFDQVFRFEQPVPLSRLRRLGCADGTNFVTARQIAGEAASVIIEEGKPSVRLS